tara:strand:- start:2784 stop:3794 length:1011 start_codon:yes stop_codon:yes gene_type:complete
MALARPQERWNKITSFFLILILSIIIGFRYRVGEDWGNYIINFEKIKFVENVFLNKEFLFSGLNVISNKLNLGIYGVNVVCASIFSFGLIIFCRSLERQWLALTLSVPYIVIVIAMGYTKQSVALGILMIGFVVLSQGKKLLYLLLNIFASLFHLSSIVGIVFLAPYYISSPKLINKISKIIISIYFLRVLYLVFIEKFLGIYIRNYVTEYQSSSSGVYIRLFLVVFPSILFLFLGKNLQLNKNQKIIWKYISFYSLSLIPLLIISPSNTIIDRMALYALPIMIFILSKLPELKFAKFSKKYTNLSAVLMAFLIQFIWLNFAVTSRAWDPYQNILF